jgi:hypothetical protein
MITSEELSVDEAVKKHREVEEGGRAYGIALAEFAMETFGSNMTPELAHAAAVAMRSDILEQGGKMMDDGLPTPLAIVWAEACARALQDRLAEQEVYLELVAALAGMESAANEH